MADFDTPQSRNEALLQNILGANNAILPPESRNEKLLQAILGVEGVEPELPPQSRIEELLYQIYLQGGVGGGNLVSVIDRSVKEITEKDLTGCNSIGNYAFMDCSNLRKVTIPESVVSIGIQAFANCRDLRTMIIKRTTPPVAYSQAFSQDNYITLWVPAESVNTYNNTLPYSSPTFTVKAIQN